MQECNPPAALKSLLDRHESIGGVIETIFLDLEGRDGEAKSTHREAAISALRVLRDRLDQYFLELLQLEAYKDRKREEFYSIQFEIDRLKGRSIDREEFFGSDDFWKGDLESWKNRASTIHYYEKGYVYAFTAPPYGLAGTPKEINLMFFETVDALFEGFRSPPTIFEWSTSWSNYFDAGHEWWGSFLWTVYVQDSPMIVAIAASATD